MFSRLKAALFGGAIEIKKVPEKECKEVCQRLPQVGPSVFAVGGAIEIKVPHSGSVRKIRW